MEANTIINAIERDLLSLDPNWIGDAADPVAEDADGYLVDGAAFDILDFLERLPKALALLRESIAEQEPPF